MGPFLLLKTITEIFSDRREIVHGSRDGKKAEEI